MASVQSFVNRVLIFLILIFQIYAENIHKSFQYKYSFKGPYLAQKDGTVPFWEYDGSAIASEEMVRITPSLKSKKGSIWIKNRTTFPWWEVEIVFRVNGRGRLGADGLAFWYTDKRGTEGPVFGSNDQWNGLGIFFDSFDNDGKGNNPYVMAMINDGTKIYDHQSDGIQQQLAGCQRDFRNKPFPVRAKIEYYKNTLSVLIHSGNTNNEEDYELCLRAENVFLPQYGMFGLSAATGALADDHDVLKFLTTALYPPGTGPVSGTIADTEKEKFSKEYEHYKEKLERQKEEYRKQHPEEAREREGGGPEDEYETQQQKELKQIFQGQGHIFELVKGLSRKVDEVIGRQERLMSMVSAVQVQGIPAGQQPGGSYQQGGALPPSIQRHEVEAVLANQKEMVQSLRDLRAFVPEIHQRLQTVSAHITNPNQVAASSSLNNDFADEVRSSLNLLKRDLSTVVTSQTKKCPDVAPSNCLSVSFFLAFMTIQLVIVAAYVFYRSSKENQAKKFY